MTLVYGGPIEDRPITDFNNMAKDAISAARIVRAFSLNVTGVEEWGSDEKVDVLTLYPTPQLLLAREVVEQWDTGEFKEFKPHVTIGPAGSAFSADIPTDTNMYSPYEGGRRSTLPSTIFFDRVAICWGAKRLVFNLSSY
jgi:2'-5' RNA ligase